MGKVLRSRLDDPIHTMGFGSSDIILVYLFPYNVSKPDGEQKGHVTFPIQTAVCRSYRPSPRAVDCRPLLRKMNNLARDIDKFSRATFLKAQLRGFAPTALAERWMDQTTVDAVVAEIDAWAARPDALYVETFCEALGWVSD